MNEDDTDDNDDSRNKRDPKTDREVSSCYLSAYGEYERRDSPDANVENFIPYERDNIFEAHCGNIG